MATLANRRLSFFPDGIILLAPFILFGRLLMTGEVLFWGLPALQFIPWRAYAWQSQLMGNFPLWNPLNGMGAPLLANYQLAWFYPPSWLTILFQAIGGTPAMAWACTLLVPIHLAFAGWGMALLVRKLGLGNLAQLISGLAFCLSGFFVARAGFFTMIWAGAWLPWIILYASSIAAPVQRSTAVSFRFYPGLVFCAALQLLAGHAQITWYTLLLAGVWVVFGGWVNGSWRNSMKGALIFGGHILFGMAIAAIQLVPTAEYLLQSQRSTAVDFDLGLTYSFWPWHFLTLLSPNFFGNPGTGNYFGYASYWEDAAYIGFLPLALALSTIPWVFRKGNGDKSYSHRSLIRFAWVILIIGCVLALGKNTPVFTFLYQYVPGFNLFNGPARWLIWTVFGLTLLAGAGAEGWVRPTGKKLKNFKLLTTAAIALTFGTGIAWISFRDIQITFIEAFAALGIGAVSSCLLTLFMPSERDGPVYKRWQWAAAGLVCADLLLFGWGLFPSFPANFFAETREKPLVQPGNDRVYLSGVDEYALKFRRFFRFSDYRPIEDWNELFKVALPNLNLLPGSQFNMVNNFDPLLPGRYSRWMTWVDHLSGKNLETVLALMDVSERIDRNVDSPDGIRINENLPLARIRWVPCAKMVQGENEAWSAVQEMVNQADLATLTQNVVLEGKPDSFIETCDPFSTGISRGIAESSQKIVVEVQSEQSGTLVVANTWYPGWQAKIDGQPAVLFRANYLFMGVRLNQGQHRIELSYAPVSFYSGAGISTFGLLFMLLWTMLARLRAN